MTLLEPPSRPLRPARPNRTSLLLIGFAIAIGVGLGAVVVAEIIDGSIHGERELSSLIGARPFAVIGYIDNSADELRKAAWRRRALIGSSVGCVVVILTMHVFVRPLDDAWFALLNQIGM